MRSTAAAALAATLALTPVTVVTGQSSWSTAVRGMALFPADRFPSDGGLGAELSGGLRLGKHFSLVLGGHAGRYDVAESVTDFFYNPDNDGLEYVCPDPCTLIPITRESRDEYSLLAATLSLRVTPLTGRRAVPWIEVGAGPYRLSERSTDRGIRRDGTGTVFDYLRQDHGWGAGAHGGAGIDWFPAGGRVGITVAARLHGAIAQIYSDLSYAAALTGGVGVVIR